MEEWVCRQNIARFRSQLAHARDARQRKALSALLAEQEANLKRLMSTGDPIRNKQDA